MTPLYIVDHGQISQWLKYMMNIFWMDWLVKKLKCMYPVQRESISDFVIYKVYQTTSVVMFVMYISVVFSYNSLLIRASDYNGFCLSPWYLQAFLNINWIPLLYLQRFVYSLYFLCIVCRYVSRLTTSTLLETARLYKYTEGRFSYFRIHVNMNMMDLPRLAYALESHYLNQWSN